MHILLVTRKYPPSVGGMQTYSYQVIQNIQRCRGIEATPVAWGGPQWGLPWFVVLALARGLLAGRRRADVIHVGDAVLTPLGLLLRKLLKAPLAVTVHGLDVTWPLPPYQRLIPPLLERCDAVICVSKATESACVARGISRQRCTVIHNGVEMREPPGTAEQSRRYLSALLRQDLAGKKLLLTVGRLVPRKGVRFFVESALPLLIEADPSYLYVIVGEGEEACAIQAAAAARGMEKRIRLAGRLAPEALRHAYNACNLFLAPNVPKAGDMEGFGLAALEAAGAGCPVLAADLEGLRDALPAEPGWFVPAGDGAAWAGRIKEMFDTPGALAAARALGLEHARRHSWQQTAEAHVTEFRRLAGTTH